jgi:hypothetical protein
MRDPLDRLTVRRVGGNLLVTGTRSVINARKAAERQLCKGETLGSAVVMGRALAFPVIKED